MHRPDRYYKQEDGQDENSIKSSDKQLPIFGIKKDNKIIM
jgi:hypothetical protein